MNNVAVMDFSFFPKSQLLIEIKSLKIGKESDFNEIFSVYLVMNEFYNP